MCVCALAAQLTSSPTPHDLLRAQRFERAPSLNGDPEAADALARVVADHLASGAAASTQYSLNCPNCVNPTCRTLLYPAAPYERKRDAAKGLATPKTVAELQ